MADSEEKELKTIKFQMMLSEREAREIDDWSFSNRIRSRAEAIRRLCQMAMIYDENSEPLVDIVVKLKSDFEERAEAAAQLLENVNVRDDAANEFIARTMDLLIDTFERHQFLVNRLALMVGPAERYKTEPVFTDAQLRALADKAGYTATFLDTKVKMFEARKKHERKDAES